MKLALRDDVNNFLKSDAFRHTSVNHEDFTDALTTYLKNINACFYNDEEIKPSIENSLKILQKATDSISEPNKRKLKDIFNELKTISDVFNRLARLFKYTTYFAATNIIWSGISLTFLSLSHVVLQNLNLLFVFSLFVSGILLSTKFVLEIVETSFGSSRTRFDPEPNNNLE